MSDETSRSTGDRGVALGALLLAVSVVLAATGMWLVAQGWWGVLPAAICLPVAGALARAVLRRPRR